MKKVFLAFLLAFTGYISFAQDYSSFKLNIFAKKTEDSKKLLDKLLADPKAKDKAETIYWQLATYAGFYYDSALYAKYPNADSIAWEALEAYTKKDTGLALLKENNNFFPALEYLKSAAINVGVTSFNNSKWQRSLEGFLQVDRMNDYLIEHRFQPKNYMDTNLVLYTAYSAQNSGKPDIAVKYYDRLADRSIRIGELKHFESNMYTFIVDHYMRNGDTENFNKYLAIGRKVFPEYEEKWGQMEMQNATTNASLTELLAKYEADNAANKLNEDQYATYGDAFAQPDKKQLAKADSLTKVKLTLGAADAYTHGYNLSKNGIYAYNIGVLYYKIYDEELGSRFYKLRGEGPVLKAARADVEKQQQQYADSAINYFNLAYTHYKEKTDLEKREKTILSNIVNNLSNLYQWKSEKSKGVNPKDVDKYDALFKKFDAEAQK